METEYGIAVREQQELKSKLIKIIEFLNSKEYFNLDNRTKTLYKIQRTGMEMYLNALTQRLYGKDTIDTSINAFQFPLMNTPYLYSDYSCNTEEHRKK